jgi:Lon protease-like protein
MTDPDLEVAVERLPIFPLPRAVLLPGELLPLHVFEPRYRALVATCLAGDRLFGVATLRPGFEPEYEGRPAIHPEIGVGRIVRHQTLPDGRSNLLLGFVAAVEVVAEIPSSEAFRRVRARLLPRIPDDGFAGAERLRLLALQVAARVGPLGGRERLFDLQGRPWVDAMARVFLTDPDARRRYLAAPDAGARIAVVESGLVERLHGTADDAEH